MRHCPNCGGEVIVWDSENEADKCLDCGESWTLEELEAALEEARERLEEMEGEMDKAKAKRIAVSILASPGVGGNSQVAVSQFLNGGTNDKDYPAVKAAYEELLDELCDQSAGDYGYVVIDLHGRD